MCYRTIKGILGSCESLCLLPEFFWGEKVKFLIFFLLGGFFCRGIVVGSLWDRCGSLWVVVGRCGSLWVVPGFSNYAVRSVLRSKVRRRIQQDVSRTCHILILKVKDASIVLLRKKKVFAKVHKHSWRAAPDKRKSNLYNVQ